MNSRVALPIRVVIQRSRNFRWYVLDESSPEGNIEKLWTTADSQKRLAKLSGSLNQRDFGFIARSIGRAAFFSSGLSVEGRIDIFAPSQKQPVDASEYRASVLRGSKWRDDHWYEACTLQCYYVRAIEPETVSAAQARVGCSRYCNDR